MHPGAYLHPMVGWLRETLGARGLLLLLAGMLLAGALWAFVELADEVREADEIPLDDESLLALRQPDAPGQPRGPAWVAEAMRDLTALGSVAVLAAVTVVVLGFLLLAKRRATAAYVVVAVAGGATLAWALKNAFARERPEVVPALADVWTPAFPSGHAMLSAVVYLTLGAMLVRLVGRKRLKVYVIAIPILATITVGMTRVYLGVHYPSDVLAGWAAGFAWALLCAVVAAILDHRRRAA